MNTGGLLGSATLEVAIGLVFIYLLLAIICTTVNEWIAGIFDTRSKTLALAIANMLDGQPGSSSAETTWFLQEFYKNPLIDGLKNPLKPEVHPAYIPSRMFASAVIGVVMEGQTGTITFSDLESGVEKLPDGDVKKTLVSLLQSAHGDLVQARANIEGWFNDCMDRVSGWYKRRTQLWTVIVASVLTLACNADTVKMAKTLWIDPTVRAELVETAGKHETSDQNASRSDLIKLDLVIGWTPDSLPAESSSRGRWVAWSLQRLLGWTLTVVAISLGAPFWFDLLNKFMRIRNAGRNPEEEQKTP